MKRFLVFAVFIPLFFFSCSSGLIESAPEGDVYIPTAYEKEILEGLYGIPIPPIGIVESLPNGALAMYYASDDTIEVVRSKFVTQEQRFWLLGHEFAHHYQHTVLKRSIYVDKSYKYNYVIPQDLNKQALIEQEATLCAVYVECFIGSNDLRYDYGVTILWNSSNMWKLKNYMTKFMGL